MALMHKDEPVADARVPCRECQATDWLVRTPRFGLGLSTVVCHACGHDAGPLLSGEDFEDTPDDWDLEMGQRAFEAVTFPVYAPAGLQWRPVWGELEEEDVESVTLGAHDPRVGVVSETPGVQEDPARALGRELAGALWKRYPPRRGRSDAAYTLAVSHYEEELDAGVSRQPVGTGTLRVEDREVPCTTMSYADASVARAELEDVVVIAYAVGASLADVVLARVK